MELRVLLAEDFLMDAELEVRALRRAGLDVVPRIVDTEPDYRRALAEFAPHVILSDFSMPAFDGMAALSIAREQCPDVPFIFVSGTLGEEHAISALKSGAVDYVLKGNLLRLPAAVERAVSDAAQRQRLARLSMMRDVLSAVNNAVVRIRERTELLEEACRIAVEVGGLALTRVALREGSDAVATVVASRGSACVAADDLIAEVLGTGRPVVRDDLPVQEARSAAGLPIVVEGAVVGAFALYARAAGHFDADQLRLLKEVTGNIAFALSLLSKQEQLAYLALYDPLTGLANRVFFHSSIVEAVEAAARHGHLVAVLSLDIARFRAVNDAFGQQGGDELLRAVARRLREAVGEEGRVARLSADRFAALVPALKDVSYIARVLLERLGSELARPFEIEGRELRIAVRAGIAISPYDGSDADVLFRNAEAALESARVSGERFTFYAPEINARFAERLELETRLRRAVEKGELSLAYQPKVSLEDEHIVAFEALMRWRTQEGEVLPGRFIPILEDTGLIIDAGRAAIEQALATRSRWLRRGLRPPRVAVNVSARQLRNGAFVEELRKLLVPLPREERGLDIEITESVLMENVADAIESLKAIRDLGVEVAIDDFGTGYSSLAYLNHLPIHLLKIDRSFVTGMVPHAESRGIVSAIIALARGLGLKVVAEGVETRAQAEALKELGCDQIQGFLVGRPMTPEEVEARLLAQPQPPRSA